MRRISRHYDSKVIEWNLGETAKVYQPFARTPNYRYFHGDGWHNRLRENSQR